ncbi:MAG: hypothetical protein M1832_001727 [Thelocarpon impressellum]|nr:MAG: hypothetical protein M1832_001727 [Thelocarpon impressellum]
MRGKRSKQYRKLMQQYAISFGFREPFQVLVDAEIIQDAARFKMDLVAGLERTLQGKVKPMITQCSMRHLYAATPPVPELVGQAKAYERRRCNHHTRDEPLSTLECLQSVVEPKGTGTNKHRYVVASQVGDVRAHMRSIAGVPLVYINRSVMIMEPMTSVTEGLRAKEERSKFRAGLKGKRGAGTGLKRKRDEDGATNGGDDANSARAAARAEEDAAPKTKKRIRGPKGPNPLSVKKPKKAALMIRAAGANGEAREKPFEEPPRRTADGETRADEASGQAAKRKRRRKFKVAVAGEAGYQALESSPVAAASASAS